MKTALAEARDADERASPKSRVCAAAPPVFLIPGDRDTRVPIAEARRFAAALAEVLCTVVFAEIPGAQHAFEIFPSVRTTFVVHGVERFLAHLYSEYLRTRGEVTEAAAAG
jgi:dipeptidyl aminopeptidase/acylaminoacyl peptidase